MSNRVWIVVQAAVARWKFNFANRLLGYAARAGQLVADADARLVGLHPGPNAPAPVGPCTRR